MNHVDCSDRVTTGTSGLMKRKSPADEDEGKTKKPTSASSKTKQPKQKTSVLEEIMQVRGVGHVCSALSVQYKSGSVLGFESLEKPFI